MKSDDPYRLLRGALLGNPTFSTFCGLTLLAFGGVLAPKLGVPAAALRSVGAVLLPFAWALARTARSQPMARNEAWLAVALDLLWVAGSAALLLGNLWPLRPAGTWAVLGVGDVVLLCAVLQWVGLARKSAGHQPALTPGQCPIGD